MTTSHTSDELKNYKKKGGPQIGYLCSKSEKLSYILNPSTPSQVNKLGYFLKKGH
jgi:hypothetical protein